MKCDRKKLLVYAMFIILAIFGILFLINYNSLDEKKEEKNPKNSLIENNQNMDFYTMDDVRNYLNKGGKARYNLVKRKHSIMKSRGKIKVAYGTSANGAIGFPEFDSMVEGFKEGAGYSLNEKSDDAIGDTCATKDENGTCLSEKNQKCKSLDDDFLKGDPNVCKKLEEEDYKYCGICVKPNLGLAVSAPGSSESGLDSVPISCIPAKNWIPPGKNIVKECEKALERIKCSKVKSCDLADVGDAKNLCAWCPIEGKAFVYNKPQESKWSRLQRSLQNNGYSKNAIKRYMKGHRIGKKGRFIPKYPDLDKCEWGKINGRPAWLGWGKKQGFEGPMIRNLNDCTRLNTDFPCLKDPTKIKTGKHSPECKQDMWESTNCTGNYESRLSLVKRKNLSYVENNTRKDSDFIKNYIDSTPLSFLDVFKRMRPISNLANNSRQYKEANVFKNLCYARDWDPCDDKFKDSTRMINGRRVPKYRPKECLDKLWKESGCTDGRYHPDKFKDFHDKKKLGSGSHYNQIQHGWPSTSGRPNVKGFYKYLKNNADTKDTIINENKLKNDPGFVDGAIFWQEACYGKVLPKTQSLIGKKKPKCFKDFQHRIGNAHNVSKPEGKLNFYSDKQIRNTKINDNYMSNDNRYRAIMQNKSPIGRDWGNKKEVTKDMYDQQYFPYWKFEKASRDNYKKPTWEKFRMLLAGDGKTYEDFLKDEVSKKTPVELRNKQALANYNANKIWGITGVSSPDPDTIQMEKLTDFTSIMQAYKVNPTWRLSRPINGKCQSCSIVPCGQCQAGCPRSECPDGRSRNHCPSNNANRRPSRCDIPKANIITKNMYANGYMDGNEMKEFPYWEFMKIAKRMGQKAFQ